MRRRIGIIVVLLNLLIISFCACSNKEKEDTDIVKKERGILETDSNEKSEQHKRSEQQTGQTRGQILSVNKTTSEADRNNQDFVDIGESEIGTAASDESVSISTSNGDDLSIISNSSGQMETNPTLKSKWYQGLDLSRCNLPLSNDYLVFEYAYKYDREDLIASQDLEMYAGFKRCMDAIYCYSAKSQQVKAAYDWLIYNVEPYGMNKGWVIVPYWSELPTGPFLYGEAYMRGYNAAFKLCMDIIGIPCETIKGTRNPCPYMIPKEEWKEWEWLNVALDGEWYHLDLFWEDAFDNSGDTISYNYFNRTDANFEKNYAWTKTHLCNSQKYDYYNYPALSQKIETEAQFIDYVAQNCNKTSFKMIVRDSLELENILYDYESVSEKIGAFVVWNFSSDVEIRGNYKIIRIYITKVEEEIHPGFVHSPSVFHSVLNDYMKKGAHQVTIVIADSSFSEEAYNMPKSAYTMEHDGYIDGSFLYKRTYFSGALGNDSEEARLENFHRITISFNYISEDYLNEQARTLQEAADIVVNAYDSADEIVPGVKIFDAKIIITMDTMSPPDVETVQNIVCQRLPGVELMELSTEELRNGYLLWAVMGIF